MPRSRCLLTVFLAALAALAILSAARPSLAGNEIISLPTSGPVQVRAENITYDEDTKSYLAEGQVEVTSGPTRLMADRVRLFQQTMLAEAEGRVYLVSTEHEFTGSRLLMDLNSEKGKLYDGVLFFRANNYWIRGSEIEKTGPYSYTMNKGSFTTCDGEKPAWSITGSRIEVTVEGYGVAHNAAMRVRDFPVIWTPYTRFPAKTKRTSGFLFPQVGQSDRDGFFFSVPYFQTLGDNKDFTATLTYMSNRGPDFGLEYRYNLAPNSKGMFMINWMPDDGQGKQLYEEGKNAEAYSSRYWIRGQATQKFFEDKFTFTANIDYVSDRDYLREFDFGYNGFNSSHERFLEWFGRGLDPNRSSIRRSELTLSRSWDTTSFSAGMSYTDVLNTDNKTTLQTLPYLSFSATRQAIGDSDLYFQMGSSYNYYYRDEGSTGHISDITPQFSLPLNFNNRLELEPSLTFSQRFYSVKRGDDESSSVTETGANYLWNFQTAASTYLYRVFNFGSGENPFKIKHGFRPFLTWYYQPEITEDDVASLASRSQGKTNTFTYGIENTFTSKTMEFDPKTNKVTPTYRNFARLYVTHSFDLVKYQEDVSPGEAQPHYWGSVDTRVEFNPTTQLVSQADSSYDVYANRFTTFNAYLKYEVPKGHYFMLDYRFEYPALRQINLRGSYKFNKRWSAAAVLAHDIETETDFEKSLEITFTEQCWGLRLLIVEDTNQRGIFLAVSLGGFGEIFSYGKAQARQTN